MDIAHYSVVVQCLLRTACSAVRMDRCLHGPLPNSIDFKISKKWEISKGCHRMRSSLKPTWYYICIAMQVDQRWNFGWLTRGRSVITPPPDAWDFARIFPQGILGNFTEPSQAEKSGCFMLVFILAKRVSNWYIPKKKFVCVRASNLG